MTGPERAPERATITRVHPDAFWYADEDGPRLRIRCDLAGQGTRTLGFTANEIETMFGTPGHVTPRTGEQILAPNALNAASTRFESVSRLMRVQDQESGLPGVAFVGKRQNPGSPFAPSTVYVMSATIADGLDMLVKNHTTLLVDSCDNCHPDHHQDQENDQ